MQCAGKGGHGRNLDRPVRAGGGRGSVASKEDLAFAFHRDGKLLRRYSTLDIAGRPDNVRASVSHYEVLGGITGYGWIEENRYAFAVRTADGRVLRYDAGTGEAIPPE